MSVCVCLLDCWPLLVVQYVVQYVVGTYRRSGYRSGYCTYIYILTCYTTLSSINTSRLLYDSIQYTVYLRVVHFSRTSIDHTRQYSTSYIGSVDRSVYSIHFYILPGETTLCSMKTPRRNHPINNTNFPNERQ